MKLSWRKLEPLVPILALAVGLWVIFGLIEPVEAFEGRFLGSYAWVPASSDNVFAVADSFGTWPEVLILRSDSDFRARMVSRAEIFTMAEVQAMTDSLLNLAVPYPAAGFTFYGEARAIVAPAVTDTIWVDGFKQFVSGSHR